VQGSTWILCFMSYWCTKVAVCTRALSQHRNHCLATVTTAFFCFTKMSRIMTM
jgi:hypothetical protein